MPHPTHLVLWVARPRRGGSSAVEARSDAKGAPGGGASDSAKAEASCRGWGCRRALEEAAALLGAKQATAAEEIRTTATKRGGGGGGEASCRGGRAEKPAATEQPETRGRCRSGAKYATESRNRSRGRREATAEGTGCRGKGGPKWRRCGGSRSSTKHAESRRRRGGGPESPSKLRRSKARGRRRGGAKQIVAEHRDSVWPGS